MSVFLTLIPHGSAGLALISTPATTLQLAHLSTLPNPRQGGSVFPSECITLPFVTASFATAPSDLPAHLHSAFERLATFDRLRRPAGSASEGFFGLGAVALLLNGSG